MNSPDFSIDMDVIRRCMLRGSITMVVDQVVAAAPVNRCMLVAKALHQAGRSDTRMRAIIHDGGIIDSLRKEAVLRQGGYNIFATLFPVAAEPVEPTQLAASPSSKTAQPMPTPTPLPMNSMPLQAATN